MSEKANLAVIEAIWLAWNQKHLNDAAALVAKHAHFRHFTLGIELHGREAILDLMEQSIAVLPERRSTVLHSHAADDEGHLLHLPTGGRADRRMARIRLGH